MSQHLESLAVAAEGEPLTAANSITVRGPTGRIKYLGKGKFSLARFTKKTATDAGGKSLEHREARHVGMIAGGTGITPMLQIVREALVHEDDGTTFSLLYANQTPADILCRQELEEAAAGSNGRFKVWYTVDRVPEGGAQWDFDTGFINADMIRTHLPAAGPQTQVLVCGPPPMIKYACKPAFEKLGLTESMQLIW